MTDNDKKPLIEVIEDHQASFSFKCEALNIEGFYRFDGCFNYTEIEDDGVSASMIHVCDINQMITFLQELRQAAIDRDYEA